MMSFAVLYHIPFHRLKTTEKQSENRVYFITHVANVFKKCLSHLLILIEFFSVVKMLHSEMAANGILDKLFTKL